MAFAIAVGISSSTRTAAAFAARGLNRAATGAGAATRLQGSFFEDIATNFQRTFATMAGPESKYYTVGITGASGLLGSPLGDRFVVSAE